MIRNGMEWLYKPLFHDVVVIPKKIGHVLVLIF